MNQARAKLHIRKMTAPPLMMVYVVYPKAGRDISKRKGKSRKKDLILVRSVRAQILAQDDVSAILIEEKFLRKANM